MDRRVINGKRFLIRPLSNKPKTSSRSANGSKSKQSEGPSTVQSTEDLVAREEVTPKTRIVVVRTTSSTKNERAGGITETDETAQSKLVELPPILTNGHTSVYLIRRPIPPPDVPRLTQFFQVEDDEQTRRTTTTTNHQNTLSPTTTTTTQEIVNSRDLASQNHLQSSLVRSGNSRRRTRRSRSRSRSRSAQRRLSPTLQTEESPKESDRKKNFFSFSRTRTKGVQANLSSPGSIETEQSITRLVNTRRSRGNQSTTSQITSANSIVLVNPEDKTIAVIENPYNKDGPMIKQHSKSLQKLRYQQNRVRESSPTAEEFVQTSRWYRCLSCLSRHMCLIIIICLLLGLIGLAGIGVSTYFLVTNTNNNLTQTVIGIAIGGALVIASLCFLCCILGCIGSREGYFTYTGNDPRIGGRVFALISPAHPNAHHYVPWEKYQTNKKSLFSKQQRRRTTSPPKNITIEMPERLLIGRKVSPKTHERQLNQVVQKIGHVVEDAKKRYPDHPPTKVIVKVDPNAKTTI